MLKFILISLFFNLINCQEFSINTYINLLKKNSYYQNIYLSHLNDYLYYLDFILNDVNRNISLKCENDLLHLKKGLLDKQEFALNFYESNAKDNPGILTGFDGNFGNFEQCIKIKTNYGLYKGKYCLISIQSKLADYVKNSNDYQQNLIGLSKEAKFDNEFNLGSIYGICIPNNCNLKDLLNSINKEVSRYNVNIIGQNDNHCSSNDYIPYTELEIICSIIALSLVFLCILAFYFDDNQFVNLFSIKKNFKKIYHIPSDYKSNEYNFIHGFKAIYGLLSAAVHATPVLYMFAPVLYGSAKNQMIDLDYLSKGLIARLLIGIDIAFFIGGFLAIVAWHLVFYKKRTNFFLYISIRFLRTIPIIISMLILDRIWPRLSFGQGPIFKQLTHHLEINCQRSFWKLFLFISNQDRAVDICQLPSWFISVDFQLYIIHYFLIKFLVQKPKFGLTLAFIQIIAMSIYSAQDIFFNNLEPYFNSYNVYFYKTYKMERQYFISTIHSNSYTLGVLTGWLVINHKKYQFLEKPLNRYIIFLLSCLSFIFSVYLPLDDDNNLPKDNLLKSILLCIWGTLFRPLYLLFFLSIFYFMSLGYFKTGKKILSNEYFLPFSKLSYTIVMSQFIYLWYNIGTRKNLFRLTILNIFKEAVFSLVISVLISNIVFVFFECPISNLLAYFSGLDKKKKQLKQDCSTTKLNSEQEIVKDPEFAKPKINIMLFDENSNSIRPKFEI